MKSYLMAIILVALFSSCATEKSLTVSQHRKTGDLSLFINPTIKQGGLGLHIIKPFVISAHFPEPIKKLKIITNEGDLLWEVESKHMEYGGPGLFYGNINKRFYQQKYPLNNEQPQQLERGSVYSLILTTDIAEYNKSFIFYESTVKITDHDLVVKPSQAIN